MNPTSTLLEVQSGVGVGAAFTVTLPRGLEAAGDGAVAEPALA